MRSLAIVVQSPRLDHFACFLQRCKPFLIQALGAKAPVERFDLSVLRWFSWLNELQLDFILTRPQIQRLAPELAAVVHADGLRHAASFFHGVQHAHHALGAPRAWRTTRLAVRLVSTSCARHCLVKASVRFKVRKLLPSLKRSWIKSMLQR